MQHLRNWLRQKLADLRERKADARIESVRLSNVLARWSKRHNFELVCDLWISSQFEEAEAEIRLPNGALELLRVCIVPYAPKQVALH